MTYEHAEMDLAEQMGVSQPTLREYRQTALSGKDWRLLHGVVRYSEDGRRKVLARFGLQPAEADKKDAPADQRPQNIPLPGSSTAPGTPGAADEVQTAVVLAGKLRHGVKVIKAELGGLQIYIRVHDAGKYVVGMKVPCRLISGDLYRVEGRGPRWRGKW